MPTQNEFDKLYMNFAHDVSKLSYCKNLKVGCVIVKHDSIISYGYNGTLPKEENVCEDCNGKTKDSTLHAEQNAILKLARSNESAKGATIYCTHSPCVRCSAMIVQAGIERVVYDEEYRVNNNELLKRKMVKVDKI